MAVQALTATAVLLPVDDRWLITVATFDDDGVLVDAAPTVTVTLPDGTTTTPTPELVSTGVYRAAYEVVTAGRHIAVAAAVGYGVADFAAYATATTTETGMPTVDDVAEYLREGASSWDTADLQDALDAEAASQRSVCRVRAVYPDDLRQALLRRVQRNLAMRQLPLAVPQGDAEMGSAASPPGRDPEVRRFEAPHRKLAMG